MSETFNLGWGVNGETWKWRRRLFAWEEEVLEECIDLLSTISMQVGEDRWVWKLHSLNCYTMCRAYRSLTDDAGHYHVDNSIIVNNHCELLKINLFAWRLFS